MQEMVWSSVPGDTGDERADEAVEETETAAGQRSDGHFRGEVEFDINPLFFPP